MKKILIACCFAFGIISAKAQTEKSSIEVQCYNSNTDICYEDSEVSNADKFSTEEEELNQENYTTTNPSEYVVNDIETGPTDIYIEADDSKAMNIAEAPFKAAADVGEYAVDTSVGIVRGVTRIANSVVSNVIMAPVRLFR